RSVIPRMPFIGVRISWLILARNSLLEWLEASAISFACNNSISALLCLLWITSILPMAQRKETVMIAAAKRTRCRIISKDIPSTRSGHSNANNCFATIPLRAADFPGAQSDFLGWLHVVAVIRGMTLMSTHTTSNQLPERRFLPG